MHNTNQNDRGADLGGKMTIVIDLAQDEEIVIRAAGKEGIDPATYIANLIRRHLVQQKAKTGAAARQ